MEDKVLVTGAGGFVGAHLVRELSEMGVEVTASCTQMPWYMKREGLPGVTFVAADLQDKKSIDRLVDGHKTVFHLGAVFNFFAPVEDFQAVNVRGTEYLSKASARNGVDRFVYFSSGAIYGPGKGEHPVDENTDPQPADNYARSKWEGEQSAFEFNGENGMKVISLRPGAIYGPYSKYGDAMALWLLKKGLLFAIPGFSRVVSSHVHVRDCIRAAIHLADHTDAGQVNADKPHQVAYNVCDDIPTPNEQLIKTAAKVMPHKGLMGFFSFLRIPTPLLKLSAWFAEGFAKITGTEPIFDRVGIDYITTHRGLSNRKLKSTGFQLDYPGIEKGLIETVKWYEETGWQAFRIERYNWN